MTPLMIWSLICWFGGVGFGHGVTILWRRLRRDRLGRFACKRGKK